MGSAGGWAALIWAFAVTSCIAVLLVRTARKGRGTAVTTGPGPGKERAANPPVRSWMVIGAGIWAAAVIVVVAVTNVVDGARLCDVTTVTKPGLVTTERVDTVSGAPAAGTGSSDKRTSTAGTVETTKKCRGIEVAQAALLFVPGLLFFAPALTALDIGGLFKLSFREVNTKLDEQKEAVREVADSIRMVQQTVVNNRLDITLLADAGSNARQGARELREGMVRNIAEPLATDEAGEPY